MHFPDGYPWLTLSAILSYEARTFLTVIPFGNIPRDRLAELFSYYIALHAICQECVSKDLFNMKSSLHFSLEIGAQHNDESNEREHGE